MRDRAEDETFLRLLKPLRLPLELYARRMLRDASSSEDVLQEAVLEAWSHFPEFTPGTNFRAWIFRFLTHKILNANRRLEPVSLGDIPVELAVEELWEMADAEEAFDLLLTDSARLLEKFDGPLQRALGRLAAPERACLLLKSIGEFTYQEIHRQLEIPVGSVMGYLARARRRMRAFLTEYAAEPGLPPQRPTPTMQPIPPQPSIPAGQPTRTDSKTGGYRR